MRGGHCRRCVFAWSTVTALGVAGPLAASAVAFTAVKPAGAAYLVWLGARALLAARRRHYRAPEPTALISLVWFVLPANVVGAMRRLFTQPRVRRVIDTVLGGLVVALGVRIAVQ